MAFEPGDRVEVTLDDGNVVEGTIDERKNNVRGEGYVVSLNNGGFNVYPINKLKKIVSNVPMSGGKTRKARRSKARRGKKAKKTSRR